MPCDARGMLTTRMVGKVQELIITLATRQEPVQPEPRSLLSTCP
jgi:hypothetical protein